METKEDREEKALDALIALSFCIDRIDPPLIDDPQIMSDEDYQALSALSDEYLSNGN